MLSYQEKVISQVMPLFGQRVQITNLGEVTGIVVGFISEKERISLAVQYEYHPNHVWEGDIDTHWLENVKVLSSERELVTA
jgi:hypothetical protein